MRPRWPGRPWGRPSSLGMPHPGSGPTSSGARLTRDVRIVCFSASFDRGECGEETRAMMSKNDAACGSGMSPGPQASVVEGGIALDSHNSRGDSPSFARAVRVGLPINPSGLEIRSVIGLPNPRDQFRPAAVTM